MCGMQLIGLEGFCRRTVWLNNCFLKLKHFEVNLAVRMKSKYSISSNVFNSFTKNFQLNSHKLLTPRKSPGMSITSTRPGNVIMLTTSLTSFDKLHRLVTCSKLKLFCSCNDWNRKQALCVSTLLQSSSNLEQILKIVQTSKSRKKFYVNTVLVMWQLTM